jgi:hypothetical protein
VTTCTAPASGEGMAGRAGVIVVGGYFLGMYNQCSRGSSLIYWVRHDAARIADQATARDRNHRRRRQQPGPEGTPVPARPDGRAVTAGPLKRSDVRMTAGGEPAGPNAAPTPGRPPR